MLLETRARHPTLAAEVIGLRLWEPLAPETVTALRELWSRRGVLVFRRQPLGEAELAAFSVRPFGAHRPHRLGCPGASRSTPRSAA
jgi:alpha-ketoglutarate-dependent taurine dioxygenase